MIRPDLPIEPLRGALIELLQQGPVVLSAPTGSGKSTRVPLWCRSLGRVLVVEPRRVACRSLARRVAQLDGSEVGDVIGYAVRDDVRTSPASEVVFATPGIALRWLAGDSLARFDVVVLDEFHERSLDTDLLLALLLTSTLRLVVMSATLDGDRLAAHINGIHLQGQGRAFPVGLRWLPGDTVLPTLEGLASRVRAAVAAAEDVQGDILVFLPGKGEIRALEDQLRGGALEILPLHGQLSHAEQDRAFSPGQRRRLILSTNVAETSVTLPRIGVVIDSGLVRRTRYHRGRAHLAVFPVARDAAEQRRGRAGRLGPGLCLRLWAEHAPLTPHTPPEVHRESLVPLVLAAAACGAGDLELPFFDPPRPYAVDDARETLQALDALDETSALTPTGAQLFSLPLDPQLGRLLVQARLDGTLQDAVDLVAALGQSRSLFTHRPEDPDDDLRVSGCDATGLIAALRQGEPTRHALHRPTLAQARRTATRLRALLDVPSPTGGIDRLALAATVVRALPGAAYVRRQRRREVAWSAGGTEVTLSRHSAIDVERTDCLVALDEMAMGHGRDRVVRITCAMPVTPRWLAGQGVGRQRTGRATLTKGRLVGTIERVHAGRVLHSAEEELTGAPAREALAGLIVAGRVFRGLFAKVVAKGERLALWQQLHRARHGGTRRLPAAPEIAPPEAERWLVERLTALGLESGADLALIEEEDLLPGWVPEEVEEALAADWPLQLELPGARYRVHYRPSARRITLEQVGGTRKKPPPRSWLPSWPGFRIRLRQHSREVELKG